MLLRSHRSRCRSSPRAKRRSLRHPRRTRRRKRREGRLGRNQRRAIPGESARPSRLARPGVTSARPPAPRKDLEHGKEHRPLPFMERAQQLSRSNRERVRFANEVVDEDQRCRPLRAKVAGDRERGRCLHIDALPAVTTPVRDHFARFREHRRCRQDRPFDHGPRKRA